MVAGTRPFRAEVRQQLGDAILDAARELTVARGWDAVRMADVAEAAGVSRRTVYNEFANRDRLADAMVQRELNGFMLGIGEILDAEGADLRSAVERAVTHALTQAAENPLVRAALAGPQGEAGSLLPYLTTDAEMVLRGATQLITNSARERMHHLDPGRIAVAADFLARVVVSNIVLPMAPPAEVGANLADLVVRYVESVLQDQPSPCT